VRFHRWPARCFESAELDHKAIAATAMIGGSTIYRTKRRSQIKIILNIAC
jgi:hypothetical protein